MKSFKTFFIYIILIGFHINLQAQQNQTIIEKYGDGWFPPQNKFEVPDYGFEKDNGLTEITEDFMIDQIREITGHDISGDARGYYYTAEFRLDDLQDITIYLAHGDGYSITYLILDNENKILNSIELAYQFAIGEYSESASGEFMEDNKYVLKIAGMGDDFEDSEGVIIEGTEVSDERIFIIQPDGKILEVE